MYMDLWTNYLTKKLLVFGLVSIFMSEFSGKQSHLLLIQAANRGRLFS